MQREYNKSFKQKSTQFWKQVSNGLRTPLNVIRGTADIAQSEIYDIETVKEGFHKIEESSDFLLNVVNDIVDFVTIENQELEIHHQPFNLNDMIRHLITKYYNKAAVQKKHLDAQVHGVIHENLIGDEHRLEQILECMFHNSLKYTTEKDRLYFQIYETGITDAQVSMRFIMHGTNRKIYDCLCGTINEKKITEATDLALYNSHCILTKMGGAIKVILDESENSEIIIDANFKMETDSVAEAEKTLFDKEHILIICDSEVEAEARGKLLAEMKVSYDIAIDSETALEKIGEAEEEKPFSACVVDWNVQNFVLQDFVNDVHHIFGSDIALIAMAYNVDTIKEQALKMGFNYVMDHTWFRSTVCDVLMKNTQGTWNEAVTEQKKKKYDFRNKHILVAEDSALNMEFIVHILSNVHADVTCAANGIEAYNAFKQKPENYFDCIIMDVNMPEMDGYEATKNIRKSTRCDAKTVPIYALTANAFQSDIRDTLEAGMNGHFSKPVDISRIYSVLENVFNEMQAGTYDQSMKTEKTIEEINTQMKRDQVDEVTGLLSFYGLEQQLASQKYSSHPVGFLLIEINNYEQLLSDQGQKYVKDMLHRIAETISKIFRSTDLLARYNESCFAIVLNYCDSGSEFIKIKVQEISDMLQKDLGECVRISAGAACSKSGYSKRVISLAFDALDESRQSEKVNCHILYDTADYLEAGNANSFDKTIFGAELFYLRGKSIAEIDRVDELLSLVLGKNQAVGIMCGTYEDGMPVCSASGYALSNLGYNVESFVRETGALLTNIVYKDDLKLFEKPSGRHELEKMKFRLKHRNGGVLWFYAVYISTLTKDGEKMWIASIRPFDEQMLGTLCDMDYVTVSVILPEENTIILEKGNDTIYSEDLKLRKKYNYESLVKNVFVDMHKASDKEEYLYNTSLKNVLLQLEQKGIYEFIFYQTGKDGRSIPLRYKYRYMGKTKKAILLTQEYVENLAESDDVTAFLNEQGFYRNVRSILDKKDNLHKKYAILYINIKDFKTCNEVLGYARGNILLRKFADYVEKSQLNPVCCARFHSDQFCFLIDQEYMDYDELSALSYKRVNVDGNMLSVRTHSGIYWIDDKEQEISTMCDKAILAAESITNEYAMPYFVFDESVNWRYQNKVFVLNNLERAFERDEFTVYYQPVCDVKTGKVCSAEALVRWIMPGGKVISPGVFVPVLENKGFISKLDLLVANKVQKFIETRVFDDKKVVPVSVNLSRMDFLNDTFLKDLKAQIEQIKVNKALFRYEVTESAYINVGDDGKTLINDIRNNRSQIYIDDFGSGYSSLQNLMEIHFDVLKLDMYFIRRIGKNPIAEGVIDGAIRICHNLGRKIIAEGVETEEQYRFLAERECDYIQGYYFYKPMTKNEFIKLLDSEA